MKQTYEDRDSLRRVIAVVVLTSLAITSIALVACGGDESTSESTTGAASGAPAVSDPWVRAAARGNNSAAYMTITGGAEADAVVAAELPEGTATEVQLHQSSSTGGMDGGEMDSMMEMKQVAEIPIPAGGSVALEPGGYHIMIIGLTTDLSAGQKLPVTLTFSSGDRSTIEAEVRTG
ncbi:MAG: copper chaperone PCu(A)C [Actinobacteria bacterium]|nr:copper chaperone PCu(A)C [Actinomycetota bacterium]